MILNLKLVLALALTISYINSLKLIDTPSYYLNSTLIKGLNLFQNYYIIVDLSKALIKLYQNRLKVLKVEYLVLVFFQLVLKISSKLNSDIINKSLKIFKIFLEKSVNVKLYDRSRTYRAMFVLSPSKVNDAPKT